MKTVVIYHRADFDGIFCREIARKFMTQGAELIGWDYGDPVPELPSDLESLYMLDISVEGLMDHPRLIWIDHHKSAIEKYATKDGKPWAKPGIQMDGVAACRLAWQWFFPKEPGAFIPNRQDFVDRKVMEPLAVRLAGEYDIWDKRDPDAELFQHGLRSRELNGGDWDTMLITQRDTQIEDDLVRGLLHAGEAIQYVQTEQNASIIKAYGFDVEFEGLKFLACNHARFNSQLFTAGVRPEHEALLGFNWDGPKQEWRVSLYHAEHRKDLDLSLIAVKHGGGGHRGACGFRVKTLPFLPKEVNR